MATFRNRKRVLIASAEREGIGAEINGLRTAELKALLTESGIKHKRVLGVYKNVKEQSFVIEPSSDQVFDSLVATILHHFDQECVLILDNYRNATLRYEINGNGDQKIGQMKSSTEFPWFTEGHTYCPKTNMYYWVA